MLVLSPKPKVEWEVEMINFNDVKISITNDDMIAGVSGVVVHIPAHLKIVEVLRKFESTNSLEETIGIRLEVRSGT